MLIGNGVRLNSNPMRQMGAAAVGAIERSGWAQGGARLNFYAGQATVVSGASIANRSGFPSGMRHPSSWSMPIKGGALAARFEASLTLAGSGLIRGGVAAIGTATLEITGTATGSRLALLTGTATVIILGDGFASASLNASGTATLTLAGSGAIGALAGGAGTATITMGGSLTSYAIGHMSGTTQESGLTTAGIANRVWSQVIEAGFSADQILRIVAAHAAGAATGLEGANPQFTGLDGATLRIDGAYNAGTRTIDALDGE